MNLKRYIDAAVRREVRRYLDDDYVYIANFLKYTQGRAERLPDFKLSKTLSSAIGLIRQNLLSNNKEKAIKAMNATIGYGNKVRNRLPLWRESNDEQKTFKAELSDVIMSVVSARDSLKKYH